MAKLRARTLVQRGSRRSRRASGGGGAFCRLEPLEVRALLTGVITLTGNGTLIGNGDTTPSVTDFTDFRYMTIHVDDLFLGTATRTYVVQNQGDSALQLTGSTRVAISGADAGEFDVTSNIAEAIGAGQAGSFGITFVPTTAGLKHATVTIESDDPNTPVFTFDIQGTGLDAGTTSNHLQTSTITSGTGSGATTGTALSVDYTGWLANGTVFDTSAGGSPFPLILGNHSVIAGWEQGLVGIKAGETRVLFIPASLAYGSSANGFIPAFSPLYFEVTAQAVEVPTAVVTGNGNAIAFGDNTPSATDKTFFGTTAAGDRTPVQVTYTVTSANSGALSFPQVPAVTITGAGSANFTATDVTVSTASNFATFTVTYHPGTSGTQTATVHLRTNDATHPDFTFDVAGTYTPAVTGKIAVSGNGTTIVNNDSTPSMTDFTDFGPVSVKYNASIGYVSRTYVIANAGDPALTLSKVQISGTNASDFKIGVSPTSTIGGNQQTTLTVVFKPSASGVRKGVISISSNDPDVPVFTFRVQGTAYATTNFTNGLQIVTTTKGTGTQVVNGGELKMTYTGMLTTGSVFDATSLHNPANPLDFTLGVGSVIQGWDQGLQGIKVGESRVLIIPAALAYGSQTRTGIPANSPLIFTVTCNDVINPTCGVLGNNVQIAYNDTTPNATDGTLKATIVGSSAPITFNFQLANNGGGSLSFNPTVVVKPKGGAHFTASQIATSGNVGSFSVIFTPTKAGTQTAVVHVVTSDPVHPDFTFTIAGTYTPFVDLQTVSIGTVNFPSNFNLVSGSTTKYNIPVNIKNLGNMTISNTSPAMTFNIYLHDITDNTDNTDTLIGSPTSSSYRGMAAGATKTLTFPTTIPITIPTHTYQLVVKMNENGRVIEANSSNNNVTYSHALNVTQGFYNVDGLLVSETYPASIVNSTKVSGALVTRVRNSGNLALPAGQKFTLQTIVHNVDTNADVVLGTTTLTLGGWAPNKTQNLSVSGSALAGLPAGNYELRSVLTPVGALTESSTSDNLTDVNSSGNHFTITVT